MIPGFETSDVQARIFDLMGSDGKEDEERADALYADLLPLLVFLMQSLDTLMCYGKRLAARRLGLGACTTAAPRCARRPSGSRTSTVIRRGFGIPERGKLRQPRQLSRY